MEKNRTLLFWVLIFSASLLILVQAQSASAAGGKTYHNLIFQNVYGPTSRISAPLGAVGWAKMVEEATKGQVTFKLFHAASLVPAHEALGALAKGTLDVLCSSNAMYAGIIPEGDMWHLPLFFNSQSACYEVMFETEAGPLLRQAFEKQGVVWLCPYPIVTQSAMTRTGKPIKRLADFKGLKFRASGGLSNKMIEKFGASAMTIHGGEIYTALQRGTIDGLMYPEYTLKDYKFSEVVKNIMHPTLVNPIHADIFIRKSLFDEMPKDLQGIIWETSKKFVRKMEEYSNEVDADTQKFTKENKIQVHDLPPEDVNQLMKICQELWETGYANQNPMSARIYKILLDYRNKKLK